MSGGDTSSRPAKLGRYELITQIGQGGMAEVQLALQRGPAGFEKLVVVKLVHENLATQRDFVEMLLDEARVAALVKHPNVVDIYDLGEAEGRFFIAMEYLEGEPLLAVLRAGREGKRLDILSTARLISDTAEGLDAAHELRTMGGDPLELVHHDVSLGNIVVLYNGQVKLVDFGVAKATQSVASRSRVQGKFSYMAPEKLRGSPGDRRSDIWSLGCVLWEALTLKRLFKGGNDADTMRQVLESEIPPPSEVNGQVPADFDPIAMRALERDPAKRYPTAKEMSADLEEILRRRGYSGKNDLIAKYMQKTFESHITARKKLLQEVSLKGRASADVLEAAFAEPVVASGSPITSGDFSVRFKRASGEMSAEGTPSQSSPYPVVARGSLDAIPTQAASTQTAPHVPPGDGVTLISDPPIASRKPIFIAMAGGMALLLVALVLIVMRSGGGGSEVRDEVVPSGGSADTTVDAAPAIADPIPETGSGSQAANDTGSGSQQGSGEELDLGLGPDGSADVAPPPPTGSATNRPRPRPDRGDAASLTTKGIQAYVRGDTRLALNLLKQAQKANPSYAATWRGLGLVYEKLGERGAARAAYQRYLIIAPSAPDAAQIRKRMGDL